MSSYKIIFESERILYTQMSELFLNDYLKMWNNQEIQKTLLKKCNKEFTKEEILKWIDKKSNKLFFTMIEKDTNDYIGIIEIMNINDNIGDIAISIIPEMQNKHYGTESLNALMKYVNDNIGLNGLELYVYKNNKKAIRCYENAGFVLDGKGYTENDVHMKRTKKN